CKLPSGNEISLFFYDGPASQAVAFEGLLNNGEAFADRLRGQFSDTEDRELVNIATDGESYGHHHRLGEMALSYCLNSLEQDEDINLTIYGEYLEKFPPQYEAQIIENTSWSCYHGVERWRS
ncbi:glycoside hydrolase, partial [Tamlana crocina]|nr:glycoside hydrolase [Tamlana crocina]